MAAGWMAAALMVALQGTHWVGPDSAPIKISFEDGKAYGKLSCNSFRTPYDEAETSLGFGGIATTRMGCAPDVMQQERLVLRFLEATRSYEIVGDDLVLKDANGKILLTLKKA